MGDQRKGWLKLTLAGGMLALLSTVVSGTACTKGEAPPAPTEAAVQRKESDQGVAQAPAATAEAAPAPSMMAQPPSPVERGPQSAKPGSPSRYDGLGLSGRPAGGPQQIAGMEAPREPASAEVAIDPNGRFATTYRPGGGHLAAFEYLRQQNAHFTIHAGEGFGLPSIWQAIQWCGADRLGHGVRIIDDITVAEDGSVELGRLAAYIASLMADRER